MKTTTLRIDLNAHIKNLVVGIDNQAKAVLSFDNLGYGIITAVKLKAKGYNAFGDAVLINGKEEFSIVLQDLHIEKNASAQNIIFGLPKPEIKKLDLTEHQICYSDGEILTYEGCDIREYEIQSYELYGEEKKKLIALQAKYGKKYQYIPKEFEDGWICSCGCHNTTDSSFCMLCGNSKSEMLQSSDNEVLARLIKVHQRTEEQRIEREMRQAIWKEKEKKAKKVKIGIGIAIGIIVIILSSFLITMAGRKTFSSETEMRAAVQGKYTYYDDDGDAMRQVVIIGDKMTIYYKYGSYQDVSLEIEWNPKWGTFETFEKWIVLSDGSLKNDGDVYEKGGYMSSDSGYSSSYESATSVLKISNISVTSNSSYTVCTGKITNNGKKTYKFVEVKGSFKNSSGTVLDTAWTYAVGSEGLAAGESTTFRMSVPKDTSIKSCTVTIIDYDS